MTDPGICAICKRSPSRFFTRTTMLCEACNHAVTELAKELSLEVREIRCERAGLATGAPVVAFEGLPDDDQQNWRDMAFAVMRLGDKVLTRRGDAGEGETRQDS